jgi:hypothetical protein
MKQLFTCVLTANKCNTNGVSPMVLLLNVVDTNGTLYRDHCWVNITPKLASIIPRSGTKLEIEIMASPFEYLSSEGKKNGLRGVKPSYNYNKGVR